MLLEIFDHVAERRTEEWHTLVHVCPRWRRVVFASLHHLNLRLLCTEKTHVREMLDVWQTLPIDMVQL
jgi:hypothetical protein